MHPVEMRFLKFIEDFYIANPQAFTAEEREKGVAYWDVPPAIYRVMHCKLDAVRIEIYTGSDGESYLVDYVPWNGY